MKEGVSIERILDDLQESLLEDPTLKRIHLTTKQDLRNLQKQFNLSFTERRCESDIDSVDAIIKEYKEKFGEKTPFKYYKPQGSEGPTGTKKEDIILVIMTPTQTEVSYTLFFSG